MKCTLCPRGCAVDRSKRDGFCKSGELPRVARIAPHYDEEPIISGKNGAGTIFFSGCALRCVYCQNYAISSELLGREITVAQLSEEYKRLEDMGVHSIELVTPTHYTDAIIQSFELYRPQIPVIYNCSGYEKVETLKRLEGLVDIYLPDFKYSDNALAERLSSCPDYRETAIDAIEEMLRQRGKYVIEDGLLKSGVMIRHLVLPSHIKNTLGVLSIIAERFSPRALTSLMSQYIPVGNAAQFPDINRPLTRREYDKALSHLYERGLEGYAQELASADAKYIPKWDY